MHMHVYIYTHDVKELGLAERAASEEAASMI